jgi:hypothetical protein
MRRNPRGSGGVICETRSLQAGHSREKLALSLPQGGNPPRKPFRDALSTDWIPAFAGMTGLS